MNGSSRYTVFLSGPASILKAGASDFLSIGSRESFEQNILFRLSPPRKAARPPRKAAKLPRKSRQAAKKSRQAGRKSLQARPGPHLKAAAKAGQARPKQSRAGLAA